MSNLLRYGWGSVTGAIFTSPMFMNQQPPPPPPDQPPHQGEPPWGGGYAQIPNYLPWAIAVTVLSVLCCPTSIFAFIIGIIAIVKAATANSKKMSGDYAGAVDDANQARTWIIVAGVLLLLAMVINFIWGGAMIRQLQQMQQNAVPRQRI